MTIPREKSIGLNNEESKRSADQAGSGHKQFLINKTNSEGFHKQMFI